MVDLDKLAAAGIHDVERRAALLEYLDELGFTVDEMAQAEREGRLFGLAGDAVIRSGPPQYSLRDAATQLGLPLEEIEHAWAVLGLTAESVDALLLSQADLDGLRTWAELQALIGSEAALGLLRVTGAGLARIAEAGSASLRAIVPAIQLNYTADELATAQAFRAVANYAPRIGAFLDAAYRQHLANVRMYFEDVIRDTSASVECGIGFVDLSGFTALTQQLQPDQLSMLLSEFSATVTDVVHADKGRVVKFIGDAVMWVAPRAASLAQAAADMVNHPKAVEAGLQVRAGIAYGSMVAVNGDYFGIPVNLAARLVAAAEPGQILAAQAVRDELPDWPGRALEPIPLKGFDEPQPVYELLDPRSTA
jgi:class 3 adenylate cyclase